ncbi:hypothetical protein [Arthrobacter oryzae]|uniref:hypothetical protein n=1 Tax=Arthrobacter oryzae TaxID=409290 RepID=UPI00273CA37F|nr:hypothetical protein [Arthrobacter oryzae]WLQ07092.1 hypothetical protein Q8Z05_02760 [Arthrobacter oryzae]
MLFHRRFGRGILAGAAMMATALLGATAAAAYWPGIGTGNTTAAVATLAPPTGVTVPAASATNVAVSWTASGGVIAPTGYYVARIADATSIPACGSSPSALITGTSCEDSSVPDGTYKYVVTAVHRTWTAVSTASGNVIVNNMDTINFSTQPAGSTTAGSSLQALTVELRTALGLKLMKPGVQVTIGMGNNPGGGTLAGTLTATTNLFGEATFTGLSVDKAGSGYSLLASSPGYAGAGSSSFAITAAAASKLVITNAAPPSGSASAVANIGPVTVERQDAYGNPVATGGTALTLTLSSDSSGTTVFAATAGGAAVGTVAIQAGASSASFFYGDTKSGSHGIAATSTYLGTATTQVMVTAAAAAKLTFGQQPTNTAAGQKIAPFTVLVLDQFGNLQTSSNAAVTIDKTAKRGNLGGTLIQGAVGGVATFSELSANPAGTYTLIATSPGLVSVTSSAFTAG